MTQGWVAYSVSALAAVVGENKLMPLITDCQCKVTNAKSGETRDNTSWVIGRLVRDFELLWRHEDTVNKVKQICEAKKARLKLDMAPSRAGLVISVYKAKGRGAGQPRPDTVYWSGVAAIVLQHVLALVPAIRDEEHNWTILLITTSGTLLALLTGALPQWKREKWPCRKTSRNPYILTRGNGAQHAIVVLPGGQGNDEGLDLEDLAAGQPNLDTSADLFTRMSLLALSTCWIILLIMAAGLEKDTWYLLAVGGIGMVMNVFTSGWSRPPETLGIPLQFQEAVGAEKVMEALYLVEEKYPGIGRSMRSLFFTAEQLRPHEEERWGEFRKEEKRRKDAAKEPVSVVASQTPSITVSRTPSSATTSSHS